LFGAIQQAFGTTDLPLIAEDLGVITPKVIALRERLGLPGMKVLQFAFSAGAADPFLPHNYTRNCVVYTGTHDNDTTLGWYQSTSTNERDFCRRYLARDGRDISWDLIRLAWSSVANTTIAPLQDVLSLGPEARMNLPGRASGNWGWRFVEGQLSEFALRRLEETTHVYGRSGVGEVDETRARPGHQR
jgi:4-alpha-glucanotransferase